MSAGGGQIDVRSLRGCLATGVQTTRASLYISALVCAREFFCDLNLEAFQPGAYSPPPLGCDKKYKEIPRCHPAHVAADRFLHF